MGLLGRTTAQTITTRAGYAGGTRVPKGSSNPPDKVCYHNQKGYFDYGKMGYGEVVGLSIKPSNYDDFAKLYFSLFVPYGQGIRDRNDPMDKGGEYRSLVGIPGGINSPLFASLKKYADNIGYKLVEGVGNEPDTLLKSTVYVMNSENFPFYRGEVYHQFHNDFQGRPYTKKYNH